MLTVSISLGLVNLGGRKARLRLSFVARKRCLNDDTVPAEAAVGLIAGRQRITDHRAGLTVHRIAEILDGNLDLLLDPLIAHLQAERLERELAAAG